MILVTALALVKGLVWSAVLPPWYGPDEASHYEYVQLLVENHWLPSGRDANAAVDYPRDILCSGSRLDLGAYGAFAAEPPFGILTIPCTAASPADRLASGPLNTASGYSPVYYASAIPFYLLAHSSSVEIRLDAVRMWSVLLGALAALFAYLAARWAFPDSPAASLAAAVLFTLQPMNSQATAIVNNDALLIALAVAFWWRFFRGVQKGVSLREWVLLGGLVGLAYLAKPQGLFLASALPVLYILERKRTPGRREIGRVSRIAGAVAGPIVAAIVVAAVFTRIADNTATLIPTGSGTHGLRQYFLVYMADHFERLYMVWITSFWGYFGWFQVDLPSVVYVVIALAVAAGLTAAVWTAVKPGPARRVLVAAMFAFLVPAALIQLLEAVTFRSSGELILQGRSFLMLLFPLLVVLMRGWQRLFPAGTSWAPAAAVLAALALNVVSVLAMVDGFYG